MRIAVVAAAICLSIVSLTDAQDVKAAMRLPTNIPAQRLGPALKEFAQSRDLQVLYFSQTVRDLRTSGAVGELTADEALTQLLSGTGLIYRYVDEKAVTILAATGGSGTLPSQTAQPAPVSGGNAEPQGREQYTQLTEIVVTATKRGELLSDVPIAVQALTGEDLNLLGARSFTDYARTLAGVQFTDIGTGRDEIFIRGVAAPQGYLGMESAIGVYLDDVPISEGGSQPDLNLYDVDRVEVLRGPQGTLYGSASLGGTIRIITNQPKMNVVEGLLDTEFAGTRHGGFDPSYSAILNLPVVNDIVAVRGVFYGRNPSGFIDDPQLGRKGVNSEDTYGGRVAMRIKPTDPLTIDLKVLEQHTSQGGYNEADGVNGSYVDLNQYRHIQESFLDSTQIYNGTVGFEASAFTVNSSTSFSRRTRGFYDDDSGFDLLGNGAAMPSYQHYRAESFTQELRLSSVRVKPFSWLLGAYFNRNSNTFHQSIDLAGAADVFGLPTDNIAVLDQEAGVKQKALFGEVGYSPIDALTFTAGVRVAELDLNAASLRSGLLFGGVLQNSNETTEHPVAPKGNISYRITPDWLLYAQATKGYRIGGVNVTIQSTGDGFVFPKTYAPDSLWNYEVGLKGSAFDRRLTFDADVFYIDWKNIQLDLQHAGYDYFTNAGNAVSKGLEAQVALQATRHLQLGGQLTFTDSKLATTTPGVGASGDRLPFVPKLSGSAFVMLSDRVRSGQIYGRLDVQQVGTTYSGFGEAGGAGFGGGDNFSYSNYTLTHIKLGFDLQSWRFAVFARNLFDRRAKLFARQYLAGIADAASTVTVTRPRTIGVQISRSF